MCNEINHIIYYTATTYEVHTFKNKNKRKSLRIHQRLSTILKTSKKEYEVMFFDILSIYILKCIQYTIDWGKTQMLKNSLGQNKRYKKCLAVLLLIFISYMSWSTSFVALKLCVWDFPFSISFCFYQGLYFCSTKCMNCLALKRHHSLPNKKKIKATQFCCQTSDSCCNKKF